MKKIILKTWFETGLGDFYTCLFATKVAYHILENLGYSVEVKLNSNRYIYGYEETMEILNNCFSFNTFNSFSIDTKIPKNFILYKNIHYAYEIYIEDSLDALVLDNIDFYQYNVESITKGSHHPVDVYRKNIDLLSNNFKKEIEKKCEELGNFSVIFLRYPDDCESLSSNDLNNLKESIKKINTIDNQIYFISSKVENINNIKINGMNIKNIEINVLNNYDRVYRDLLNMCMFYKAEKIYYKWYHYSNYTTFGLIHNEKLKNFDKLFIPLI